MSQEETLKALSDKIYETYVAPKKKLMTNFIIPKEEVQKLLHTEFILKKDSILDTPKDIIGFINKLNRLIASSAVDLSSSFEESIDVEIETLECDDKELYLDSLPFRPYRDESEYPDKFMHKNNFWLPIFFVFNILANNEKKYLCGECIKTCINDNVPKFVVQIIPKKKKKITYGDVGFKEISNLKKIINNLRNNYNLNIQDAGKLNCIECQKDTLHYSLVEKPPKNLVDFGIKDIKKDTKKKILDFYFNIDILYGNVCNPEDLEVDHKTPRATMNKNEKKAHDELVELLENTTEMNSVIYWKKLQEDAERKKEKFVIPEISIEKSVYDIIYNINPEDKDQNEQNQKEKILNVNKWEFLNQGINRFFQLLTPSDNKVKKRDCWNCQHPKLNRKKTRYFPLGLKYFYKGDIFFDEKYPRCEGCFWYCPFSWWADLQSKNYEKYNDSIPLWKELKASYIKENATQEVLDIYPI